MLTFSGYFNKRQQPLRVNSTLSLNQDLSAHKKILLNIMAPPLVNTATELQAVFKDVACKNCIDCMERAIKAQRWQEHMLRSKPALEELYYTILNENHSLYKRGTNGTKTEIKTKGRSKGSKSITITKYSDDDGKIYALKVKESHTRHNETDGKKHTCKIYNVAQSLPCDSFGSEVILEIPKKKVKRDKKPKLRQTTESTKALPSSYRKRDTDNSAIPESFMLSIEDMY